MPQCTYGSRAQAGAPAYFWFTWSAFIAWLALRFARLGTIVWAFFGDVPFKVDDFCATEIAIPTVPTTAQWLGFFTFDFAARLAVEQYLIACFKAYLWGSYCECTPDPTPGSTCHPYFTSAQTFIDVAAGSAWSFGRRWSMNASGQKLWGFRVWLSTGDTSPLFAQVWDCSAVANVVYADFVVPTGGTHNPITVYLPTPIDLANGHNYYISYTPSSNHVLLNAGTGSITRGPVDYGPSMISTHYATIECVDTRSDNYAIDPIICSTDPTGVIPYTAPLPTDPTAIPDHPEVTCSTTADLCSRMNALQSAVLMTRRDIDWLQAQTAPTCWVPGTAHTGLTGAGTFAVADVVGAYVTMSVPSVWGRTNETPARTIPKAGELQFAVDGVVADDHQLHYDSEQILGAPAAANSIVYNFRLGVTGTITPLQRCK